MENEKLSLNEKQKQLDSKVEWFYSDDFKLEESAAKYKEVRALAASIEKDLEDLKNEIEVVDRDFTKD